MDSTQSPERWRVRVLLRDQHAHMAPIQRHLGESAEFIVDAEWDPDAIRRDPADLVLCVNDYHHDVSRCLEAARAAGIPSLALQDGVLEWRCQYENGLFGAGGGAPQHQPVLTDKIACLGHQSARHIAAWGNADKVEVTGMPRMDVLAAPDLDPPRRPGSRLLVMTAKNPGFTPEQREVTLRSLREVRAELAQRPGLEVIWRVSREVAENLGVVNEMREASSLDLLGCLKRCDAVLSTLSTAMLEAMLCGRAVAALDYHNVPRFLGTAWTVTARDHLGSTLDELMNPSERKLSYQRDCLSDALRLDGPAAPRVADLLVAMAKAGREARAKRHALCLPGRMVPTEPLPGTFPPPRLAVLYPGLSVFEEADVTKLRLRLARAENELKRLKRTGALTERVFGYLRRFRRPSRPTT